MILKVQNKTKQNSPSLLSQQNSLCNLRTTPYNKVILVKTQNIAGPSERELPLYSLAVGCCWSRTSGSRLTVLIGTENVQIRKHALQSHSGKRSYPREPSGGCPAVLPSLAAHRARRSWPSGVLQRGSCCPDREVG